MYTDDKNCEIVVTGKIRVAAQLFYDFFVLLSNQRFESQSDVYLTGSLCLIIMINSQIFIFFVVHFKEHQC